MSYSIETYDKAQNILDRRKEKATLEAQSRIDKLCAEIPELNVINRKLAQIGLNISRTFLQAKTRRLILTSYELKALHCKKRRKICSRKTVMMKTNLQLNTHALRVRIRDL